VAERTLHRLGTLALLGLVALPSRGDEPVRIYADSFITWIYPHPRLDEQPIGYLRAGTAIRTKDQPKVRAAGCSGGFRAIEPTGYVCVGRSASTTETRYARSLKALAPQPGAFPFDYALSMGSPAYRRLPTPGEVKRQETKFGRAGARPLPAHWQGHEELALGEYPTDAPAPEFLADRGSASRLSEARLVRREVPFGSMIATTGALTHEGRKYLVSADGTVVPAERFRPFRRSTFAGVALGDGVTLPLGWTRRKAAAQTNACIQAGARNSAEGRLDGATALGADCLGQSGATLEARTLVQLSGRRAQVGPHRFAETRTGHWIKEADLFIAERPLEVVSRKDKWIHFSIGRGTLIAFVGEQAVFATLASPGSGGRPRVGGDPLTDRTTPLGTFRIQFKHRTDDMSPEQSEHRSFFIADVPYAQFFQPPFAIHVAYWHESFGEPMSGGCINVSPRDGERLFAFTDPPLPDGWHGVGAGTPFGPGTWVRVTTD